MTEGLPGGKQDGAGVSAAVVKHRHAVLAAAMLASFMADVESTIVGTAMPTTVAELGNFELFSWVFADYLLIQSVGVPIYGRLADKHGRKSMFFMGAGLFLLGSLLCGLARA